MLRWPTSDEPWMPSRTPTAVPAALSRLCGKLASSPSMTGVRASLTAFPSISSRIPQPSRMMRTRGVCTSVRRIRESVRLGVYPERGGALGTPAVQCVGGRPVPRFPGRVLRNVIEVEEVLGEAAPWVANVVEEVGADHVPAEAPERLPAALPHAQRAHRHLVDAADLERAMVEARTLRLEEREVVVVGAAAHEGHDLPAAVGEPHAEDARG